MEMGGRITTKIMDYKYLNELNFSWTKPYNSILKGVWMFDALSHPHAQWVVISIQSNPRYYTTWGICQLLDHWKLKVSERVGFEYIQADIVYEECLIREAVELEIHECLISYRVALDNLIAYTVAEICDHIVQHGRGKMMPYDQIVEECGFWSREMQLAFK